MTTGIYLLEFNSNSTYIGQSKNIEKRYRDHLYLFNTNNHTDKLQKEFNTYGKPAIKIVCICNEDSLDLYENIFLSLYIDLPNNLNTLKTAEEVPKPDNRGTRHGLAKYSENQIIDVLKLLVQVPFLQYSDIERSTGVSYSVIANIASLSGHTWLKEYFPEEYELLASFRKKRNFGKEVNTSEKRGKVCPSVISPTGEVYSNITNIAKFMREHGITSRRFYDLINRKETKIMGWALYD